MVAAALLVGALTVTVARARTMRLASPKGFCGMVARAVEIVELKVRTAYVATTYDLERLSGDLSLSTSIFSAFPLGEDIYWVRVDGGWWGLTLKFEKVDQR